MLTRIPWTPSTGCPFSLALPSLLLLQSLGWQASWQMFADNGNPGVLLARESLLGYPNSQQTNKEKWFLIHFSSVLGMVSDTHCSLMGAWSTLSFSAFQARHLINTLAPSPLISFTFPQLWEKSCLCCPQTRSPGKLRPRNSSRDGYARAPMGASPKEDAWQAPTDVNLLPGLQSSVARYFNKGRYCTVQEG